MSPPTPRILARGLLLLLLTLAIALPAAARDITREEMRRSMISLLSGHHYRIDRKVLDQVSPEANKLLVDLSGDPNLLIDVRVRATASLTVYPSPRSKHYLQSLLFERSLVGNNAGRMLRRTALRALGSAFGGEAVRVLLSLQSDTDPQIREACARALGDTMSDGGLRALEAWLPNEPVLTVRIAIDESAQLIRDSRREP